MRSFIAFTLLVVAVFLGFGAMGAQWLDRLARTPAPMQRIVGPLAQDEQVISSLKGMLITETKRAIPPEMLTLPTVGEQLDAVVTTAVDAVVTDPGVQRAWNDSVNRSRVAYVAELDRLRGDESLESPTVWFDLTPFADLGRAKLREVAPATFHVYLDQVQVSQLRLPLGQPSASMSKSVADGVGAARQWPFLYLGAGVLAVVAMFIGTRRGRWVALALAGVVAAVVLWFGRLLVARVGFPGGDSLAAAIRTSIVDGGTRSFLDFIQPGTYAAYAMIALGLSGALIASLVRRR